MLAEVSAFPCKGLGRLFASDLTRLGCPDCLKEGLRAGLFEFGLPLGEPLLLDFRILLVDEEILGKHTEVLHGVIVVESSFCERTEGDVEDVPEVGSSVHDDVDLLRLGQPHPDGFRVEPFPERLGRCQGGLDKDVLVDDHSAPVADVDGLGELEDDCGLALVPADALFIVPCRLFCPGVSPESHVPSVRHDDEDVVSFRGIVAHLRKVPVGAGVAGVRESRQNLVVADVATPFLAEPRGLLVRTCLACRRDDPFFEQGRQGAALPAAEHDLERTFELPGRLASAAEELQLDDPIRGQDARFDGPAFLERLPVAPGPGECVGDLLYVGAVEVSPDLCRLLVDQFLEAREVLGGMVGAAFLHC